MTDGGLLSDGRWQRLGYLRYELLHRTWQTHVLQMIATRRAGDEGAQRLVAQMRRRYRRGFVAYLQGDVRPRMQQVARYLAFVKWSVRRWRSPASLPMIANTAR